MKNRKLVVGIVLGGIFLMGTGTLFAQGQSQRGEGKKPPTFKQLLKEMDADEDGKLSKKEVTGPLKKDFDKIDANEDGFITEKEMKKAPKPKRRN